MATEPQLIMDAHAAIMVLLQQLDPQPTAAWVSEATDQIMRQLRAEERVTRLRPVRE